MLNKNRRSIPAAETGRDFGLAQGLKSLIKTSPKKAGVANSTISFYQQWVGGMFKSTKQGVLTPPGLQCMTTTTPTSTSSGSGSGKSLLQLGMNRAEAIEAFSGLFSRTGRFAQGMTSFKGVFAISQTTQLFLLEPALF